MSMACWKAWRSHLLVLFVAPTRAHHLSIAHCLFTRISLMTHASVSILIIVFSILASYTLHTSSMLPQTAETAFIAALLPQHRCCRDASPMLRHIFYQVIALFIAFYLKRRQNRVVLAQMLSDCATHCMYTAVDTPSTEDPQHSFIRNSARERS